MKNQLGLRTVNHDGSLLVCEKPAHTGALSNEEKLDLFRRLFHGRQDVFAEKGKQLNERGKHPFWPVRKHDWSVPHKSSKGIKSQCSTTCSLIPLEDHHLENHLRGKQTIGIYALLSDETCRFLAHDFDKGNWMEDVLVFLATCDELQVPAYLERSQSGTGAAVEVLIRKGGMSEREIKEFQERLLVNQGSRVILASGKAIGEGFDDPRLDPAI